MAAESSGRLDNHLPELSSFFPVSQTMGIHLSSRFCSTLAQRQMEKKILLFRTILICSVKCRFDNVVFVLKLSF